MIGRSRCEWTTDELPRSYWAWFLKYALMKHDDGASAFGFISDRLCRRSIVSHMGTTVMDVKIVEPVSLVLNEHQHVVGILC